MTATAHPPEMHASTGLLTGLGIAFLGLGALAMLAPLAAGIAVELLVGALIVVSGAAQLGFAFRARSWGLGILTFLLGGLSVAAGLLMLAHPLLGLTFLTLVMGAWFVADGLVRIGFAFRLRPRQGWAWPLLGGGASVLLAFLILSEWPLSGTWAVGLLTGIQLLFTGFAFLGLGSAIRRGAAAASAAAPHPGPG